ncbi:gamma-aminobutyric acid receptor subunit alpha-6 [Anopheles coustani]|uniref:gamma-aminobutyric acid receptor subunit alpha-6 n=1 Tax=Anopheles coustani TaxID=139045 RepID=UPI002658C391|nr:gamma-aminobutyric acid receptor subunit alpha-6 [Anopheles coustani]
MKVVARETDSTDAGEVKSVHPHDALQRGIVLSTNATIHGEGGLSKRYRFFYIVPSLGLLKGTSPRGHGTTTPRVVPSNRMVLNTSSDSVLLLGPTFVALGDGTMQRLSDSGERHLSVEMRKLRHFPLAGMKHPEGIGAPSGEEQRAEPLPTVQNYRPRSLEAPSAYKSNRYYIYTNPVRPRVRDLDGGEPQQDEAAGDTPPRAANGTESTGRVKRRSAVDDMLSKNITIILENLLKRYENSQIPTHGQGVPTVVQTNILIRSMGPVSELDMDYSMDCYFRQYWRDKRLSFHGPIKSLSLSIKMLERIWRPDTYFYNGKHSHVHTITVPNKLLRLSQDGEILYSMRLTIKASCLMELRSFPMDRQSCPLVLGSYAYSRQQLVYQWKDEDSVNFVPGMALSQFDLISFGQMNYTFIRREGEFTVLHVSFNLQRHTGYFLIQVYVPCILIVVLSWVSFWIHREATSDRVGLGITTVLTLSTISLDSRTDLPKVRYATALDWFLLMSFFYCIATLLEFAGVHYFTKVGSGEIPLDEDEWEDMEGVEEIRDLPTLQQHLAVASAHDSPRLLAARRRSSLICPIYNDPTHMFKATSSHLSTMERTTQTEPPKEPTWKQVWLCFLGDDQFRRRRQREASARGGGNRHVNSVSLIDQAARILFPTSFTFFNILYWLVYYTYQADFTWSPLKEV